MKIRPCQRFCRATKKFYVFTWCVSALDQPAVLAQVAGILGRHEISIASVIQKTHQRAEVVPVVMMTHEAQEGNMQKALAEIDDLPVIAAPTRMIRVEEA